MLFVRLKNPGKYELFANLNLFSKKKKQLTYTIYKLLLYICPN